MRTGGLQTVSFIHSLSDGKVSVEYFLCARYCGEYGDPRKSPGFEEFEARKDRSKKIISTIRETVYSAVQKCYEV